MLRYSLFIVLVLAVASAYLPANAAGASNRMATVYTYDLKVAMKGGATLDGNYPEAVDAGRADEVVEEHFKASYSVDGRFKTLLFPTARVRGVPSKLGDTAPATVNGTWSTQGVKLIDPLLKTTGSFSCSGRIEAEVPPGTTVLEYRRSATKFKATLTLPSAPLRSEPACADADGSQGSMAYANGDAYETTFTINRGDLGRKTIRKSISGPVAGLPWRQYECNRCTFSMAWQGTAILTLKRKSRVPKSS